MASPWWLIGALLPFVWTGTARAVVLRPTSATVPTAGAKADVCVVLDGGGALVAGTQNDLTWDGSCATLATADDCRVDAATGKSLHGALGQRDFAYRGLVLSLSDVDPIPDGPLYCCAFIAESPPGSCCAIRVENVGASDPYGRALVTKSGVSGRLCVAAAGAPTAVPTPTPAGQLVAGSADGSGCQIAPARPNETGPAGPAVAMLIAAVLGCLGRSAKGFLPRERLRERGRSGGGRLRASSFVSRSSP